jgi:uncharacterized membrane protein (GlpM family)
MRLFIKVLVTLAVIITASQVGRKFPTLAGLLAVMPLTGLAVLVWMYLDNPSNHLVVRDYCKGALWGIVPAALFFLAMSLCFSRRMTLSASLLVSGLVWGSAALVHQLLLGR